MRKSDTITSEILDLIDTKMLQSAPHQRLASRGLVTKFAGNIAAAKATHTIQVARGEVAPLSDHIRDAVGQVEEEAEMEGDMVFQNQTLSSRSSGAMLAHGSHQSSRRNKSELKRKAKQSMRFTRNHAGASSHLSSRMDKSNLVAGRPPHGVPRTEIRPNPITNSILEAPELRDEEVHKASQPPAIVIDGEQCESPRTMSDNHVESHSREARLLEEARIPELEPITRNTGLAGETRAGNPFNAHYTSKNEHSPSQMLLNKIEWQPDRPWRVEDKDSQYIAIGSPPASSSDGPIPRTTFQIEEANMRWRSDVDPLPSSRGVLGPSDTSLNKVASPPSSFRIDPSWPIYVQLESIRRRGFLGRFKGRNDDYLSSFLVKRDIVRI